MKAAIVLLYLWTILFLLLSATSVVASEIILQPNISEYPLTSENFTVYVDTTGQKTLETIIPESFQKMGLPSHLHPHSKKVYWLRIVLRNNSSVLEWVFEQRDPNAGRLDFFAPADGFYSQLKSGLELPMSQRSFQNINHLFPFSIRYQQKIILYLKISGNESYFTKMYIKTPELVHNDYIQEYFLTGIYFGVILLLLVYHLANYISIRASIYLHYSYYATSCLLYNLWHFCYQFLWPELPYLNTIVRYTCQVLFIYCFLHYVLSYLLLKGYRVPWKIKYIFPLCLLILISDYFFFSFDIYPVVGISAIILTLYQTFRIINLRNSGDLLFTTGIIFVFVAYLVNYSKNIELLPSNWFTVHIFTISFIIEAVLFALSLRERIQEIKKAKESADQKLISELKRNELIKDQMHKQLEEKVKERVSELGKAFDEIKKLHSLLTSIPHGMSRELPATENEKKLSPDLTFEEFVALYPNQESCLKLLGDLKWENGFLCKKCQNVKYSHGRIAYARRCTRCGFDEAPTYDTLLHHSKIPLVKAFYLMYQFDFQNKELNSNYWSKALELSSRTIWEFQKKLEARSSELELSGQVIHRKHSYSFHWIKYLYPEQNKEIEIS